jgi:DedD protein
MGIITEEQNTAAGLGRRMRAELDPDQSEITLGMRSLLGIFFGLVLICGIFFGLGYSVGRSGGSRNSPQDESAALNAVGNANLKKPSAQQQSLTPAPEPVSENATQSADGTPETAQTTAPTPTPTAAAAPAPAVVARPAPVTAPAPVSAPVAAPVSTPVRQNSTPQGSTPVINPTPLPQRAATTPAPVPHAASVAPTTAAPPPGSFVVQIAAVRLPQDATVLASALEKRGYRVTVRNEPQDTLLHVQVGPFTTRADAYNMRSRLLADGYNAVVK